MKKTSAKNVSPLYSHANVYKAQPLMAIPVAPGDSISSMMADLRAVSAQIESRYIGGALLSIDAFYCPFRLVWDDWISFLDGNTSMITAAAARPEFWTPAGDSDLTERVYRQVWNDHYCDGFTLTDVDVTNTDGTILQLPTIDRVLETMFLQTADVPDPELIVDVDGTDPNQTVTLTGRELRLLLQRERQQQEDAYVGDDYRSYLQRFGVKADESLAQQSEWLWSSSKWMKPKSSTQFDSTAQTTINVTRFDDQQRFAPSVGPKFFAEHGLVFLIVGLRPKMRPSRGRMMWSMLQDPQDFYDPGYNDMPMRTVLDYQGAAANQCVYGWYDHYTLPERFTNLSQSDLALLPAETVAGRDDLQYPDPNTWETLFGTGELQLGGSASHLALDGFVSYVKKTRVSTL